LNRGGREEKAQTEKENKVGWEDENDEKEK
jgi:hypothetical protein